MATNYQKYDKRLKYYIKLPNGKICKQSKFIERPINGRYCSKYNKWPTIVQKLKNDRNVGFD